MNLSTREKWIAAAAAIAVTLLLLDRWALSPLWEAYRRDIDRAAMHQQELARAQRLLRPSGALAARWRRRVDGGVGRAPSAAEAELLGAVERWANEARVTITSVRPERLDPRDGLQVIRTRVVTEGSMSGLARICWEMENAAIPLRIEGMRLSSKDSTKDAVSVQWVLSTVCLAPEDRTTVAVAADRSDRHETGE
jgi:hypothetical protein